MINILNLKIKIASNVLEFIQTKENIQELNNNIQDYAKLMHVTLKKKVITRKIELCLIDFLKSELPIDLTLNNLYNVIK